MGFGILGTDTVVSLTDALFLRAMMLSAIFGLAAGCLDSGFVDLLYGPFFDPLLALDP